MVKLSKSEAEHVRSTVFFGSLPTNMFEALIQQSHFVTLNTDQRLFDQGEKANAIFAVVEGLLKLTVEKADGTEILVETFQVGTSFAEALVFGAEIYPVSATALAKSKVLVAPHEAVKREVASHPEAVGAMLAAAYRHLHGLVRQIEELKGNSGTERLAGYILARIDTTNPVAEMEIPFDKRVLASLLGVKPESLSRAFRRLADYGVTTERRVIRLSDPSALQGYLDRK